MTYELAFLDEALKEWRKLDAVTREQFRSRLAEHLQSPKIPSARLHGAKEHKIKLRNAGYRLVYEVRDRESCWFWSSPSASANATRFIGSRNGGRRSDLRA